MSGRLSLRFTRGLGTSFHVALVACSLPCWAAPAFAQSADTAEAPTAPTEPPVAPPAPDPPTPAPSEPAPPSQAPPTLEPTPAATLAPANPPEAGAPNSELPAGSAAFAPLPAESETAKPATAATAAAASVDRAPPAKAAAVPPAAPVESDKDDDSGGLLGPFRIGILLGTGLPEVANFGAQLKLTRFFGVGVNVGVIPTVKIKYYGEAAQKYQEYDVYGHLYPFGGSFFLGAGVGYAQIDGTLYNRFTVSNLSVDVTSDATVRTLVLTPQIGFLKIFDVGFAIGFDLGAQIPIAPTQVEFHTVATGIPPELAGAIQKDYINPNDEKVRHTLDTVGRTPLPTFNFKLGWFL